MLIKDFKKIRGKQSVVSQHAEISSGFIQSSGSLFISIISEQDISYLILPRAPHPQWLTVRALSDLNAYAQRELCPDWPNLRFLQGSDSSLEPCDLQEGEGDPLLQSLSPPNLPLSGPCQALFPGKGPSGQAQGPASGRAWLIEKNKNREGRWEDSPSLHNRLAVKKKKKRLSTTTVLETRLSALYTTPHPIVGLC